MKKPQWKGTRDGWVLDAPGEAAKALQGRTAKERARRGRAQDHVLDVAELKRLFQAARTPQEKMVLTLLFYSGMRVGELAHMHPSWVDLRAGAVTIPASWPCSCFECISERSGMWHPKTPAGARVIPVVEPEFEDALRAWMDRSKLKPRSGITISLLVRRVALRAGLPKAYAHGIRATRACYLASVGFTIGDLLETMGWVTLREAQPYIRAAERHFVIGRARELLPVAAWKNRLGALREASASRPDPAFA